MADPTTPDTRISSDQLLLKLDRAREDLRDGIMATDEYLSFIGNLFDGDLQFALASSPPPIRKVLQLVVRL